MRVDRADVKLEQIRARLPAEEDWRYVRRRKLVRVGNFVQPLRTGKEAFPAMLAAIAAAKNQVHLETYMLRADRTGNEFKEAMIERARAGVRVRLLFDSLGSFGLPGSFLGE